MRARDLLLPRHVGSSEVGTYLEVPCGYGVIDVVHVRFNTDELRRRAAAGLDAVPQRRLLMTLRMLADEGGVATIDRLAGLGQITPGRLRTVVGPQLEARGWVRVDGPTWQLLAPVEPPVLDVVAVEIKLTDVNRGLAQAGRYGAAAELVVAAVGPDARVRRAVARYAGSGIGIVQIDDRGGATAWATPTPRPNFDPLARACLSEQLAHMRQTGARSGPVREVFGRMLVSAGVDPRFPGASGSSAPSGSA